LNNLQVATQYANDVINNTIPSCIYVKQAAQRFLNDLNSDTYYYDEDEVNKVVSFINALQLTEQVKPKHFKLEPWQTFIVANIYGICKRETELRKYRSAYIELARKNGKSQLVTALALYHTIFDSDAQVVVSANSREQAKNVDFKKLKQFASQIDPKQKHLVHYYNSIKFKTNELIVTASDPKKLDGLNASFCLIDELHEAPDNKMYNVMKSSQGAREEPLLMTITTAGFDTESFCYSLRTYCTEILSGEKQDDSQFAIIYTIDPDDKLENKEVWLKANPNLDVSVYSNFLEAEVNKAINNETERSGVAVKNFNVWMKSNTEEIWIPEVYINGAMADITHSDLTFNDYECVVGVDLSSVSDITAVSYMFEIDGMFYFLNDYYIPEYSISSNYNREMYKEAAQFGHINITEGNVVDYDLILKHIQRKHEVHNVKSIYYDKYNATQFAINATEAGFYMNEFSQLAGNLNKPLKEFERLIKSDRVIIQRNPITKWMLNNVVLKINQMGNYSIDKSSKNKKIDGVAAMIDALGGYISAPNYSFNVW
jgi:phage terminase large subunit-like protein